MASHPIADIQFASNPASKNPSDQKLGYRRGV